MPPKSRYPIRQTKKLEFAKTPRSRMGQTSAMRSQVREIKSNWGKGTSVLATGTIITRRNLPRMQKTELPTALKMVMPYIPAEAVRIIKRDIAMRQNLSGGIRRASYDITQRGFPSPEMKKHKIAGLNTGRLRGQMAKVVFFPYSAVEEVYSPEIIRGLARYGIKKKALMRWSHSPRYIDEQWRRLGLDKKRKK